MELSGRVAIVTGSSRGIGKAYAMALAQAGASVVVAARTLQPQVAVASGGPRGRRHVEGTLPGTIGETAAEIEAAGGTAIPIKCHVTQEEDVKAMVRQTMDRFGRIDVLVNNAAIYPRFKYLEVPPDGFDTVMHVNVRAPYLCSKHVLPHMIQAKSGSVINITSNAGEKTSRGTTIGEDLIMYALAKASLNRLTTFLSLEVAEYGIAVNALSPGLVRTDGLDDALPEGYDFDTDPYDWRPATPEVLGPAIVALARQTAQTMTGKIVHTSEHGTSWP